MDAPATKSEDDSQKLNLLFYCNRYKINGQGETIDEILEHWYGNYRVLEVRHDYIQWLFPTSQPSLFNTRARSLTLDEAAEMSRCTCVMARFREALNMILDFWGFLMKGSPAIIKPKASLATRRRWLGTHNDLRVSRVLMSASELGVYRVALAFGACLVWLVCTDYPSHRSTCQDYWLGNIRATLHKHQAVLAAHECVDAAVDEGRNTLHGAIPSQVEPGNTKAPACSDGVDAAGVSMLESVQPAPTATPSVLSVRALTHETENTIVAEEGGVVAEDGGAVAEDGHSAAAYAQEAAATSRQPASSEEEDITPTGDVDVDAELHREHADTYGLSSSPSLACAALPLLDMPLEEVDRVLTRLERACKTGKAVAFQDLWSASQER